MEHGLMEFPPHPFWDFALDVYRRPGVSEACLELQEQHHVDVNLLLFVCWVGASGGGPLNREEIARCRDAVASWHDSVVRPLRGVRRTLKGGLGSAPTDLSDALRRAVQAREIDAEHIEQLMLAATIRREPKPDMPLPDRLGQASRNALAYLAVLNEPADAAAKAGLAVILNAVFPQAEPASVKCALDLVAT
jgi:uncharacterized protein (TIGR02444 family)